MDGRIDFSPLDANSAILSDDEMRRVDKTIDLVEAEIARLERERDAHTQHLIRLRATRSSVRKLPSELLSRILAASVQHDCPVEAPDDVTLFTLPYMKLYVPWVARQVSRRWRNASMGAISLWNHVRLSPPPQPSSRWPIDAQQAWECLLDRARDIIPTTGPVYLHLQLSKDGQLFESEKFYTRHTIKTLHISLGDRLKGLALSADALAFYPYLFECPGKLFAPLETLTLHFATWNDSVIYGKNEATDILQAHSLRTLRILSRQKLPFHRNLIRSLQWPQLTEIQIEYPVCARTSINTLLSCLAQCSSLERATLKVFANKSGMLFTSEASQESEYSDYDTENTLSGTERDDSSSYPSATHLCTLPRLTSLKLSISSRIGFLAYLRVPKLSYFLVTYAGRSHQYDVFMVEVACFLDLSACSLRTFIENTEPSAIDYEAPSPLEDFLTSFGSTVEELHTCMVINGSTMQKIADAKLLPKLKAFKFCVDSFYEPLNILEKRLGFSDPDNDNCTGIRKIRMVYPFDTKNNPVFTREERSKIEQFWREKEANYRGLELYFGPKGFTTWTDTRF